MTRDKLAPHFAAAEFDCHDGTPWPLAARDALEALCAALLEPMRTKFGPVRITSGFRTRSYNASVGGAAASYHRYDLRYGPRGTRANGLGLAADVVCARGNPLDWQKWARARYGSAAVVFGPGRGAAVAYPRQGFVHVDSGPSRTWAG